MATVYWHDSSVADVNSMEHQCQEQGRERNFQEATTNLQVQQEQWQ